MYTTIAKCLFIAVAALLPISLLAQGGGELASIPFESIPVGTKVVSSTIDLQGEVNVTGNLAVQGSVAAATIGFVFPDGTIQSTAANNSDNGASANAGLYQNRISNISPPLPFTEMCIVNGSILIDIHVSGESTSGGNCVPGDTGWVIERNERPATTWAEAKMVCLLSGMRLPEPFEFSYSCIESNDLALNDMTGNWEWVSNSGVPLFVSPSVSGVAVSVMGDNSCGSGSPDFVGRNDGAGASIQNFRCVR